MPSTEIAPAGAQRQDLRCSTYSRTAGIDPIGTAGCYRGYLLVEWPLPWPRDLSEIPALAPVAAAASGAGLRLQGLVAGDGSSRTVICYSAPSGPFRRYQRSELVVEPGEVADAAMGLAEAAGRADDPADGEGSSSGSARADRVREATAFDPPIHDVLVCTHGRRDRCCGSLGTSLASELAAELAPQIGSGREETGVAPGAELAVTRLWRTSHTGGHRFAPTAIVLPEGTVWGMLEPGALLRVLERSASPSDVLPHYRGCAGLAAPQLQVLERRVIAARGWEVLDAARSGRIEPIDEEGWSAVTLDVAFAEGHTETYRAEVGVGRTVSIPDCGEPVELSNKVEMEQALRHFARV